jgi:hypothetical protein
MVSLQLALLRECTNLHDVKKTLVSLPADINKLYRDTLQRIRAQPPGKAQLARDVLVWVVFASRSLTIEELQEAVAICPDTHKFERDRLVPEATLIGACHGLVAVEETTRLVRLVREWMLPWPCHPSDLCVETTLLELHWWDSSPKRFHNRTRSWLQSACLDIPTLYIAF